MFGGALAVSDDEIRTVVSMYLVVIALIYIIII